MHLQITKGRAGSTSKSNKEGIYPTESAESAYLGSSVLYGGRDFYTTSAAINTSVNPENASEFLYILE